MPEKRTVQRAAQARRQGKAPTTQAGEFVREEIHHIRQGKHGARSVKQAIAIGLSKARRSGVPVPPARKGSVSEKSRSSAKSATATGERGLSETSRTRSRATTGALKREGGAAASKTALSRHSRSVARKQSAGDRSAAARKAAATKGAAGRSAAARKAVRTRTQKRTLQ